MKAHITNDNGKYVTYLLNKELELTEFIQLCDRDIPFTKYEVVEVLINNTWTKKRLMNKVDGKYMFDDGTEVLISDNITRSLKPEISTGYYEGELLNFYFDPENTNKKVKGENMFGRIIIKEKEYKEEEVQLSHQYFKIRNKIKVNLSNEQSTE